jgi:hypothetical protein
MPDVTSDTAAFIANPNPDQLAVAAPATPSAPQPPTAQQAMAADVAHHALFGKAVKSMVGSLNNTQTAYRANPETGQVEEVQVPQRPGFFFRNLLSGMLIGAAAGGSTPTDKEGRSVGGGGFLAGVGRGAAAAMQNRQQQDQERFKRAQEQLKSQQEQQRISSEDMLHKAQVAHLNVEIAGLQQNLHHADQETIDRRNASARAYAKALEDQGGVPAKFTVNGRSFDTMSASDLARAYTADPTIARAATEGSERHLVDVTDLSELHFNGTQWLNDAGDPVNMSDKTQIRAYDVPTNSLKKYRQVPNSEINKIAGAQVVDPKGTSNINGEGLLALRSLGLKNDATATRTAAQKVKTASQDKSNKQIAQITSKRDAAIAKANHTYYSTINSNPANQGNATQERAEALKAAEDSYQAELVALRGKTPQSSNTLPAGARPILKDGKTVGYVTADGKRVDY